MAVAGVAVAGTVAVVVARHAVVWCESSPRFAIAEIRIEGARRVPADSLEAQSGVSLGDNLFRLDPQAVARRFASNPWIASTRVTRRFPHAVAIEVVEREPVALLPVGPWHAIDAEGRLMPVASVPERLELPLVAGCFRDGALDAESLRRAARFLEAVRTECDFLLRDVSEVNVKDPEDVTIYTVRSGTAVRLGSGEYEEKLDRLLLVLQELSGRERVPLSIDMRFRGQAVVRFRGA